MPGARWQDSLAARAQRTLSASLYAYVAAGSFDSVTRDEAAAEWGRIRFAPHVLRDVTSVDLSSSFLGTSTSSPIAVAPTAMQRLVHPDGELAVARAAAARGALHVVSMNSGTLFSDLGETGATWWLQAYLTQDRDLVAPALHAAATAGASAVALTVDTPFPGPKPSVPDNGFGDLTGRWRVNFTAGGDFGDGARHARDLSARDIAWIGEVTGLPVVVKGVLRPDDARRCVAAGAAGVWVSTHGGRQLDRAVSTARALPAVGAAVAGEAEVYVDGGIRSGLDVLAALSLGADGVFTGRLPLFGLAADGTAGVERVLAQLDEELEDALALAGLTTPRDAPGIAVTSDSNAL